MWMGLSRMMFRVVGPRGVPRVVIVKASPLAYTPSATQDAPSVSMNGWTEDADVSLNCWSELHDP